MLWLEEEAEKVSPSSQLYGVPGFSSVLRKSPPSRLASLPSSIRPKHSAQKKAPARVTPGAFKCADVAPCEVRATEAVSSDR